MPLQVALVSPEKVVYEGDADLVIARTTDGEIGFQQGHVPFVGSLVSSVVRIASNSGEVQLIAVHSGFVELSHDHVTFLSDDAELAQDIDVQRATTALERAEEALRADSDAEEASAAKLRAETRIAAHEAFTNRS